MKNGKILAAAGSTDLLRTTAAITIEAAAGERKRPRISILAYSGGIMRVAGFGNVLVDLAGMKLPKRLSLLADHETRLDTVLGTAQPRVHNNQLIAEGSLSTATPAARMVFDLSQDGVELHASVGVEVIASRTLREGESVRVNGRDFKGTRDGVLLVTKSELKEISVLPIGADALSAVDIAATGSGAGNNGDAGAHGNEGGESQTPEQLRAAAGAEARRLSDIRRLCLGRPDTIEATAITEGWDVQRTELETLRANRPKPPMAGPVRDSGDNLLRAGTVLEAALCLNAGCDEKFVGKHYPEQVMNEALRGGNRQAGIHDALRMVLRAAGVYCHADRITPEVIRSAFEADRMMRASGGGFSTISLPGILGNVANKALLEAYSMVATSWNQFCAVAENSDFKTHSRYRLVGIGEFTKVGEAGELKHITLAEQKYESQLDTQGAMIAITRQMIINDDLSAMVSLTRVLGRMAAIALEKAVYTLLLSNPNDFFGTANGNYQEGAGTSLSIDSVSAAEQLFLEMTDPNGDPVLAEPSILLVPPALRATAFPICKSQEIRDTTASKKTPIGNPLVGRFTPVMSPWLSNENLAGYSAKAWYLFTAAGSGVNAIEVAFLNGKAVPTIESGDTSFETLGLQLRSFWDFGVALQDFRGGVKSKGEA